MNNSTKTNDLIYCSEITDISKWDLHGLNAVTGYKDETSGIEEIEEINKDDHFAVCSSCKKQETEGFLDVVLQQVDGDFYCETCIQKEIDRENAERKYYDENYSEQRPEDALGEDYYTL
jgi:late competence protein required for DNA uptake (superfamily II DNA/RNA helicase)